MYYIWDLKQSGIEALKPVILGDACEISKLRAYYAQVTSPLSWQMLGIFFFYHR